MKKLLLTFALCGAFSGFAQVLTVGSIEKIAIPGDASTIVAGISPNGDYLLLSTDYNKGLTKFDLATSTSEQITAAPGAGFDARISRDGNNVVYRETSFTDKHLRMVSLKSHNLATRTDKELVKPTRKLEGVQVAEATALAVEGGKLKSKSLNGAKAEKSPVLYTDQNYRLFVNVNGKAAQLTPLGETKRYLWPALSPDGTKALFFVGGDAAYVCNLDGTGLLKLGTLRAAKWLNDNVVVGMNDKDNGEFTISSEIVAVNLQGQSQVLTGKNVIAVYPYPTATGDKVAFHTPAGEAYIININK